MPEALFVVAILFSLVPIAALLIGIYVVRKLHTLQRQVRLLEVHLAVIQRAGAERVAPTEATAPPMSPAVPAPPIQTQAPALYPVPVAAPPPIPAAAPIPAPAPLPAPAPPVAIRPAPPSAPLQPAARSESPSGLEQLIGGIWLQNVGSVLLLLGSFFLILWGYTQGKVGPEILILAGVVLGVFLAWRGDRIARTIRPLGHALLGVGLGVVFIAVYLGHFQMHTLTAEVAFTLLALVSFVTIDIGLRRGQSIIAALGIFGAFMPLLLSSADGMGFRLPQLSMLGYLLLANAIVVVLTTMRGWSGLVIESLFLTSVAWLNNQPGDTWSFPIQVGLSALFTALGMAPVVRLIRSPDPIRRVDLAVVALAPMLLLVTSLPYFEDSPSATAGAILLGLGVLNLAVALWVDARRTERDLWRPLTAAATIFITAALERLLAKEDLALAWSVEGAVLVWLGLGARGGWFRLLGYAISAIAALRLLFFSGGYTPGTGGEGIGIVTGAALRDLLCIVVIAVTADRMGRRREHLSALEKHSPGLWIVAANALGMIWLGREAGHFARLVAPLPIGTLEVTPGSYVPPVVSTPMMVLLWSLQTFALFALARLRTSPIHRHVGYGVGVVAFFGFIFAMGDGDGWVRAEWMASYPTGFIMLGAAALFVLNSHLVSSDRAASGSAFRVGERYIPEVAVVLANIALLLWTARIACEWAYRWTPGVSVVDRAHDSRAMLAAAFMSGGWIVQAGVLFAMGWMRRSPFYRWLGLAFLAITLLKFVLFDLQRVDVFWRFVGALGIGAALLLLSFIYQRGKREQAGT